jgi:class 3 adenylate cyclase
VDGTQPVSTAFVSCDIVGHSAMPSDDQLRNVAAINGIVADAIAAHGDDIRWASGGDGGHIVLCGADWPEHAVELITALRQWSTTEQVALRVVAHHGPVFDTTGADGRHQFVGDGINTAGWILELGTPHGVVVSEQFRAAYRAVLPGNDATFHEQRALQHKNRTTLQLWLASFGDDLSHWSNPSEGDRDKLAVALAEPDGWGVLYHAKRIMQINPDDAEAVDAVLELSPVDLTYRVDQRSINPFLGHLEPPVLREIVQIGQLVERRYNEVICRYRDRGETMFVILHGQIGVYKTEGIGSANPAEPGFVMNEGEIVGELAFTLGRPRTADLIALTDTALLSFTWNDFAKLINADGRPHRIREIVERFIAARVLEHVCHSVPYLLGSERDGPLATGRRSWREALSTLAAGSRLETLNPSDLRVSRELLRGEGGLYILAAGRVGGVQSGDTRFPLLWTDIPGSHVRTDRQYSVIDGPVKVLHIGASAIAELEPAKRSALYNRMSAEP